VAVVELLLQAVLVVADFGPYTYGNKKKECLSMKEYRCPGHTR
jgi:hypothetical protein